VIRDTFVIPTASRSTCNLHVSNEYLVQVPTLLVCDSGLVECGGKLEFQERSTYLRKLFVEIPTYHDLRLGILSYYVLGDLRDPGRPLFY